MKKHISILILILILTLTAFSQIKHDILYLKDGSIFQGNIKEDTSQYIIIKQINGNTFVFSKNEIEKAEHKSHRYINYTSAGFIMGSAQNAKPTALSILTENNIQFNNYWALGITTGVELLNETTIPLAFNCKIYLPLENNTIYLSGLLGKSFSADKPINNYYEEIEKAYGGVMAGINAGIIIPLNYSSGLFFEMGYRYNELNYRYATWSYGDVDRTHYLNRLNMRFGVVLY